MCFAWISEQTAIISVYPINWLVFITEAESVYCAVRTGSLNQKDTVSSLTFKSLLVACTNRFNNQEFYALPTLYLCVLYLFENKQRLVSLTA